MKVLAIIFLVLLVALIFWLMFRAAARMLQPGPPRKHRAYWSIADDGTEVGVIGPTGRRVIKTREELPAAMDEIDFRVGFDAARREAKALAKELNKAE